MLDAKNENLQNVNEEVSKIDSLEIEKKEVQAEKVVDSTVAVSEKTEEEVVNEIEDVIAESSEKEAEVVIEKEELPDYEKMGLEELVSNLDTLIKNNSVQKINNQVNAIKNSFNLQFSEILAEKKEAFIADGGESIDFSYSNPLKVQFNTLVNDFRDSRTKYYKSLESDLKDNLEMRFTIIEQLKDLIENADSKTMYNQFRDIQDRWRKIGPVAREKYNGTWRTFHHHVERFYDLLHLNNDLRDLDFKHNLDEKLKLVAKSEALSTNSDVNFAFKQLQELHKMWKEDIGPVAREFRDDVWNRFSAATKIIHDKRHENFKILRDKYEENVVKKFEVIALIDAIDTSKNASHVDWQKSIKLIESLRDQFFKVGNVPKSESDKIWGKFKNSTRKFNHDKNSFYKNIKDVQQDNLNKKMALIEQAESLKDSEDWQAVTEVMKKIQSDWRKIGHVPRKYSDKIWKQFKDACNHYFDRFHVYQSAGSPEEQAILEKKNSLLEVVIAKSEGSDVLDLPTVKGYISEWRGLGRVPNSMRGIESKFSKVLDSLFGKLSIDKTEKEMIKFENQMEGLLAQQNFRKLDGEQLFLRKKIDESVKEVQQLENNISFFSNANPDNPLFKNVMSSIEKNKSNLIVLKSKLSYLRKLDY